MRKAVIAIALCVIAIAIGLGLPKIVANSKDDNLNTKVLSLNKIEGNVSQDTDTDLSLIDKIKIIGSSDTSYVGIEYGKYLSEKDVIASAEEFAGVLNGAYINVYEIPEIDNNCTVTASVATENYGAGRSFICWNVSVTLGEDILGFDIDDETGKVLKFTRVLQEPISIDVSEGVADCVAFVGNQLAKYYGFSFNGLDYPTDERIGVWRIRYTCNDERAVVALVYSNYGWVINEISHAAADSVKYDAEISIK